MLGVGVLSLLLSVCAALPSHGGRKDLDHYWGEDECGWSSYDDAGREPVTDTFVVNGWEARAHEFPYLVSVETSGRHVCQGNIINTNTILTAAHCIYNSSVSHVTVGAHDLKNPDSSVTFAISSSVVHEGYEPDSVDNDIAILKLDGTIEYNDAAQPICPPSRNRDGYAGVLATVTGWGYTGSGLTFPDIPNTVNVPVWDFERCQDLMPVADGMICAADNDLGRDSCVRDSGSPLAWKNEDGRFELVGLVSWGYDCGDPVFPGVYADVEYYEEWIDSNM